MIDQLQSESEYTDHVLTAEEMDDLKECGYSSAAITYRSQDFDVAGLVRRLNAGDIIVTRIGARDGDSTSELSPFQRGFVWNKRQMDSFIESLLLEYPIPGLFFVQQSDRRLVVLDGQQRLETLRRYYSGQNNDRVYRLELPDSKFNGQTYNDLSERYRRTLDDTYITSTIIILGPTEESYNAVYDVFARLNSGGTQLTPHEIRMALFTGDLMSRIDGLNNDIAWRKLYGSTNPNRRFRDHELILRILALYLWEDKYSKPLGRFLNRFAQHYRNAGSPEMIDAEKLFLTSAHLLADSGQNNNLFSLPGRKQLNTARADSIMVALMRKISSVGESFSLDVNKLVELLDNNTDYLDSISKATSDDVQVHKRVALATEAVNNA